MSSEVAPSHVESSPAMPIPVLESIDRSFSYLMFSDNDPKAGQLDPKKIAEMLESYSLVLPKILTNNPLNNELGFLVSGRKREAFDPKGRLVGVPTRIIDTRKIHLFSSNSNMDEMNPMFVHRVDLGSVPVVVEGFQDYDQVQIALEGKTVRRANQQDLEIVDLILKTAIQEQSSLTG